MASFLDILSKLNVSLGYQLARSFSTLDVSQVVLYLGKGGRSLKIPLKKRLIRSSVPTCCPRINERADRQLFIVPYCAPDSYNCVRKKIIFGTDAVNKSTLFALQNVNHFFKQLSYCFMELSEREANMMWIEDGGTLLLKSDARTRDLQPG